MATFLTFANVILIKISYLNFLKIRTGPTFYDFWSGPVRSFVGTVRTDIFHFYEKYIWNEPFIFSIFRNFDPDHGPDRKKIRRGTDFFGLKSVPRTGPGSRMDQTPDHVPDQQISDQKSGTVRPSMIMISSLVPLVVVQDLS